MVQETKWSNSTITDARLNEQTIFWGTTKPSSGLEANSFWLDTDNGELFQNTGTEGTPVWTSVMKQGFTSEGTTMPAAPTENDVFLNTLFKHLFMYDGTNWKSLITGDIITGIVDTDLTSDEGWVEQDATNISYDATNDRIAFDAKLDGTNDAISIPITSMTGGANITGSFALEFKMEFTTWTNGSDADDLYIFAGVSNSASTQAANSNHDCFMHQILNSLATERNFPTWCDAEILTGGGGEQAQMARLVAQDDPLFYRIIRNANNGHDWITWQILDTSRQLIEQDTSDASAATFATIDNFWIGNRNSNFTHDHTIIGYVDDIKIFTGLSKF